MARYAPSLPNYIGNSGSGQRRRFAADPLQSAGYTFGGQAARNVDLASTFAGVRANSSYDPASIAVTGAEIRASEKMANDAAKAGVVDAFLVKDGMIDGAKAKAEGMIDAYDTRSSSAFNAFKNIGLGALKLAMSDEDTKHTIDEIDDALETLRKLRPVTFYYKEKYTENPHLMHHGFIAQEYQKVMPDATYIDSFTGKLCIDTGDLIGLLVRANQQLESRITRLEVKQALATV